MNKLAQQLIKLGHEHPELRDDIRPVLDAMQKQASGSIHITATKHWSGDAVLVKCVTLLGYSPDVRTLSAQPSGVNLGKLLKAQFKHSKMELAGPERVECLDDQVGLVRMFKVSVDDPEQLLNVLRYGSTRYGLYWNSDMEI